MTISDAARTHLERIQSKGALIGIVGMGYVGLPLAMAFCNAGARVMGYDLDPTKIEALEKGESYIKHIEGAALAPHVQSGALQATADMSRMAEADALLICVPTPLSHHFDPDLSFVVSTTEMIARTLRKGQLVILESTTYPGTTAEVMKPILEAGGLKAGTDFYLAYSPEREDPGNPDFSTARIPKVVGADDADSLALAIALYNLFTPATVPVSSAATAEAVKITENVFRSINIALVNELKLIYDAMGIDVWEVIDAAKTKPFGFMAFYPGPGLGGHCIPIDPFYLTWKAREYGMHTKFIELAGQINSDMPGHIIAETHKALDRVRAKGFNGSRILVLGLAYKKNVDDIRESPSLRLMELLEERGAQADFHDPYVARVPNTREHPTLNGRLGVSWDLDAFAAYDAVLIATDHDDVDYKALASRCGLVIDTRNACARAGADMTNVVKA
jgi:UDP-N-acetyl-D-glucosamine dehydrogenase